MAWTGGEVGAVRAPLLLLRKIKIIQYDWTPTTRAEAMLPYAQALKFPFCRLRGSTQ